MAINRIKEISSNIANSFSAKAEVEIDIGYPVTKNSENETNIAADIASEIVGEENVNRNMTPVMGSEDFSFMLNKIPGAYICIGQKDKNHKAFLHTTEYDFNDNILPIGAVSYTHLTLPTNREV